MSQKKQLRAGVKADLQVCATTGLCYRPQCKEPLVRVIEGHPIINFQYAHIRDELPPSDPNADIGWRFWPDDMSQAKRNLPENIILLCALCHKLIDKVDPRSYSVDLLKEWKKTAEKEGSLTTLGLKSGYDDDFIQKILQGFKEFSAPNKRSAAELLSVSMDPGVRATSKPKNFNNPSSLTNPTSSIQLEESWPPVHGYKQMAIRIVVSNNSDEAINNLHVNIVWNLPTYKIGYGGPSGEEGYRVIGKYFYQGKNEKSEIVEKNVFWASSRYESETLICGTISAYQTKVINLYRVTDKYLLKSPSISYSFSDIDNLKWHRSVEGKLTQRSK